jgi:1-acyl-sn-glycerol-3-phosphate acyltransferase
VLPYLPRPVRRLLLPLDMVILVVLAALFATATAIGLVVAPLTSRRRALRLSAFALSYVLVELASLTAATFLWIRHALPDRARHGWGPRWISANERLLGWALGQVLRAGQRCLGFEVLVVESSDTTALAGADPVLVLARHGGPGDSFALVHLLLTRYHRGVRIVLKDILQLDPLIDVLLNRLDCCFLPSPSGDGGDMTVRLTAMARRLGPGEALLLFPEGANWTPHRRQRAINRLRRDRKAEAARAATLMTNVLPPRPGGVLACLDARPDLGVVVVAHAGLDRVVSARQAWDQLPITMPMKVRAWPTAEVPPGEEARLAWLTLEWAVVDEWVDAFHGDAPTKPD